MIVDQCVTCQPAEAAGLMRTRYFPGLLLGSSDLTQDQTYFLEKLRRHNRMLHGWGIVCGVRVRKGTGDCEVVIEPGYILGPYGDEILVDQETSVDLCREGLDGNALSPCGDLLDPWCSDVRVDRQAGQTLYLAIKYDECQTRPVRSGAASCGCELTDCEYSRVRDRFAIKALTRLPSTYDPMPPTNLEAAIICQREHHATRPCPTCPSEPWVILADVRISADGKIDEIDCRRHRRYVVSFADYYFLCRERDDVVVQPQFEQFDVLMPHKEPVIIDTSIGVATQPNAVAVVRSSGGEWLSLPVHFDINPGETWAELLDRERDREFFNPLDNSRFTLGELAAVANVNANETLESLDDALLPFEGMRLNVSDFRTARAELSSLLDASAINRWERDHAATIASLSDLPATDIQGVGTRSTLGRKLRGETIGSIAGEERSLFVGRMLEDIEGRQRGAIERQARAVWTSASRIARRRDTWEQTRGN